MLHIKYLLILFTAIISFETLAQPTMVEITAPESYLGKASSGTISIRYSNIALGLRRPLIVAEGFDPGHITAPEKRFGETNINTGFLDDAQDVALSANLAALLGGSTQQYDIIYLDWANGTDYLRRNALLLEEVIRWVNNNKVAVGGVVQPNVVLGAKYGRRYSPLGFKRYGRQGAKPPDPPVHQLRCSPPRR